MFDWTFEIEVITPLVLSGASQDKSELRPSSIKNLMRFWYRTCFDTSFLNTTLENQIYGSTDNQGKFKPLIKNVRNLIIKGFKKDDFNNNKFTKWVNNEPLNGINYLGFSLEFGENKRSYINPTTTFDLCLKYFGNSEAEKKSILASLWLLIWLGNVGTRSRRGFGSLSITNEPPKDTDGLIFYFNDDISKFDNFFQTNLKLAISWINPQFSRQDFLPQHTALISNQSKIHLWKATFPSWEDAMNYAGIMLQRYRKRYAPDYQEIKDFIHTGRVPKEIEKVAFGLPMPVQYKSLSRIYFISYVQDKLYKELGIKKSTHELDFISERKWDAIKQLKSKWGIETEHLWKRAESYSKAELNGSFAEKIDDEKAHLRRSSPLFIKIIKIKEDVYSTIFVFMPAEFLPEGANVKISAKERKPRLITTDFNAIEKFFLQDAFRNNSIQISF